MTRGFISLYLCVLLAILLSITGSYYTTVSRYHEFEENLEEFRMINRAEVLVIHRVKQNFLLHRTEDESLYFEDCTITLKYRRYTCHITIESPTYIRERVLKWDEIEEIVRDYY